jgi:4-hydroxymandelate oxidase
MAFQRLLHDGGEAAMAAGAAAAGAVMVVSTRSSTPLREIAAAAPEGRRWLQLYVLRDRSWTEAVLEQAVALGCSAIVLTADTPYVGPKIRRSLLDFEPPEHLYLVDGREPGRGNAGALQDPSLTPEIVAWIRERCALPVLVKGVLRGDDAVACVEAGAQGVVVSNHGGRQLDGALASAEALPEVAAALAGRGDVYVDGGLRGGSDVLRALALGARAVLVGRPLAWALAAGGEQGVARVLEGLRQELQLAMALAGATTLSEVTSDLVAAPSGHE